MKAIFLILLVAPFSMPGQRLERQPPDPAKVVRVETAKDHLTVIELAETVTMVAAGNRNAFTLERRENKVLITPVDESARTNLLIWTSAGRYAYELVPAKDVEQMHFAIDQMAQPVASVIAPPPVEPTPLPAEMLTQARPVLLAGERDSAGRAEVTIRDLYRKDDRVYIRYAIRNRSRVAYQPVRPAAWRLDEATAYQSLVALGSRQLGERLAQTVRARRRSRLEVVDSDHVRNVAAGDQGFGWLALEDKGSPDSGATVLKLQFGADERGFVDAYVVMPASLGREAAGVRTTGE